jgi:hypothetical protein
MSTPLTARGSRLFPLIVYTAMLFTLGGCANGIVGKNTNKNITGLDTNVNNTVNRTVVALSELIPHSRDSLLDYLHHGTRSTTRDISMGILEGTIGYLDSPYNAKLLVQFIDDLIVHTAGNARVQLILLRDSLVSPYFVRQIRGVARDLMHELIVNPAAELFDLVISENTRRRLDALLRMPIKAILNDSAILQIGKLRETLLGQGMRGDIVSLIDTALGEVNNRLKNPIHNTIGDIVEDSSKRVKNQADNVLYLIIGGVILIAVIIFFLQEYRVRQNKKLLYYVTREIENFRETSGEENFQKLTGQIRKTMLNQRLEGDLRKFLYDEGINKTT